MDSGCTDVEMKRQTDYRRNAITDRDGEALAEIQKTKCTDSTERKSAG